MASTGAATATNNFGEGGLISRRVGSVSTFYTFDANGSVSQRLDSSGAVLSTAVVDGYGNLLAGSSPDPFGYVGQLGYYTDSETG